MSTQHHIISREVQLHTKHDFILGHVVSDADIKTDPSKIEKNKQWNTPR